MAKKKKITQKKLWPKEVVHLRSRYVDHSQKFLDWVNGFGFEKTVFGKLVVFLDNKFRLRQLSLLFLYCFSLSFLLFYDFDITPVVRVGRVASVDFKAPISFTMIDEVATEAKKIEAEDSIPPVFDYDPDSYENIFNQVYKAFGEMRKLVEAESWPSDSVRLEEKVKKFLIVCSQANHSLHFAFHQLFDLVIIVSLIQATSNPHNIVFIAS